MQVLVTNRNAVQEISPHSEGLGRTVLIRITSYSKFKPLQFHEQFEDIMHQKFADVEDNDNFERRTRRTTSRRPILPITEHEAKEIVNFVRQHADKDCLIVHCDAGFSRSPAVALAACEILGLTDESRRLRELASKGIYQPNQTVFNRITEAAGLREKRQKDLEHVFGEIFIKEDDQAE